MSFELIQAKLHRLVARVRRDWLDMFRRICASNLAEGDTSAGGDDGDDPEWAVVRLRFGAVIAARIMLGFGSNVEVVSPPEVRADQAAVAAAVVAQYTSDSNMRLGVS